MPRPTRIHFPGAVYHVYTRGVARGPIFGADSDRAAFLRILTAICRRTNTKLLEYCLMGNHFHLILRVSVIPLADVMQRVLSVYAKTFNQTYERSGHLFEARYQAKVCISERYLANLVKYIHLNPVKAGLIRRAHDWPWSSCRIVIDDDLPEDFDPWQTDEDPGLLRAEIKGRPELQELAKDWGNGDLKMRSKRPALVQARRSFAQQAMMNGYRKTEIALWLGISEGAVRRLVRMFESANLTPVSDTGLSGSGPDAIREGVK